MAGKVNKKELLSVYLAAIKNACKEDNDDAIIEFSCRIAEITEKEKPKILSFNKEKTGVFSSVKKLWSDNFSGSKGKDKKKKWTCTKCTLVNEGDCANCGGCFTGRNEIEEEKTGAEFHLQYEQARQKTLLATAEPQIATKWKCSCCETENPVTEIICSVCSTERVITEQMPTSTMSTEIKPAKLNLGDWECLDCSQSNGPESVICETCEVPKGNTQTNENRQANQNRQVNTNRQANQNRQVNQNMQANQNRQANQTNLANKNSEAKSDSWKCNNCNETNSVESYECDVCNEPRPGFELKKNSLKPDEVKWKCVKCQRDNTGDKCACEKRTQWICPTCDCKNDGDKCTDCDEPYDEKTIPNVTAAQNVTAAPTDKAAPSINDTPVKEDDKDEDDLWICTQCTYQNPVSRPGCEMCSAPSPSNA